MPWLRAWLNERLVIDVALERIRTVVYVEKCYVIVARCLPLEVVLLKNHTLSVKSITRTSMLSRRSAFWPKRGSENAA